MRQVVGETTVGRSSRRLGSASFCVIPVPLSGVKERKLPKSTDGDERLRPEALASSLFKRADGSGRLATEHPGHPDTVVGHHGEIALGPYELAAQFCIGLHCVDAVTTEPRSKHEDLTSQGLVEQEG